MPPMDAAECKRIYDDFGSSEQKYRLFYQYHKAEIAAFVDMANLKAGESVLDIGTGMGWVALEAKKKVQHGRVIGVDASPVSLQSARVACVAALGNNTWTAWGPITFVESDFSNIAKLRASLGTPTPSFDAITCCAALQHVPGGLPVQSRVLKDLTTLLTPGGRIIVDWLENPTYVKVAYVHYWPYGRPIFNDPNPHASCAIITKLEEWDTCESLFRDALSLLHLHVERLDHIHYDAERDLSSDIIQAARDEWADGLRKGTLDPIHLAEYRRVHASKIPPLFEEWIRQEFAKALIDAYKRDGYMASHSNVAVRAVIKRE